MTDIKIEAGIPVPGAYIDAALKLQPGESMLIEPAHYMDLWSALWYRKTYKGLTAMYKSKKEVTPSGTTMRRVWRVS